MRALFIIVFIIFTGIVIKTGMLFLIPVPLCVALSPTLYTLWKIWTLAFYSQYSEIS